MKDDTDSNLLVVFLLVWMGTKKPGWVTLDLSDPQLRLRL